VSPFSRIIPGAAIQGRKALQITWDEGPAASESSASLRQQFLDHAAKPGRVVRHDGDADAALNSSVKESKPFTNFPSRLTPPWSR